MSTIRAFLALATVAALTAILMPVQALALFMPGRWKRIIPRFYHGRVAALLGLRVKVHGQASAERPLLLVSNHISWSDIVVLGSITDLVFVAKSEVRTWPIVGCLARLQRSVFVDRQRRRQTARQTLEIAERMKGGDAVMIFAEGSTSDGNVILTFKSALLGAATQLLQDGSAGTVTVQPVAIAYTGIHGLVMGRQHRRLAAWIGDMSLGPHVWNIVRNGPVDVEVAFADPRPFCEGSDRKALARELENRVRRAREDMHKAFAGKVISGFPSAKA